MAEETSTPSRRTRKTNQEEVVEDVRDGPLARTAGDPKDDPRLPDDVSAIADPEDPTRIMDPGEDPDFGGRKPGR